MSLSAAARRRLARRFDNLDASESLFITRQTERIKTQIYGRKYPTLKARQYVPITNEGLNLNNLRIRTYSQVGIAKLIQAYSDDLPRADVKADEFLMKFVDFGSSYGWSIKEARMASANGTDLESRKADAARRACEVLIDRILCTGDTATGIYGLLNQPNASTYAVAAGASLSTAWADKTPEEILADMIGIVESIPLATAEVETPNQLILPREQYVLIKTTRFATNSDKSILDWFEDFYSGSEDEPVSVRVGSWRRLSTAGSGGTTRMIAYRNDPTHIEGYLPNEFEQLTMQERNLELVVPCIGTIGGVISYYPLSQSYGDGI